MTWYTDDIVMLVIAKLCWYVTQLHNKNIIEHKRNNSLSIKRSFHTLPYLNRKLYIRIYFIYQLIAKLCINQPIVTLYLKEYSCQNILKSFLERWYKLIVFFGFTHRHSINTDRCCRS